MDLVVFVEQICGGAVESQTVWLKKFGAELYLEIWSCMELCHFDF
jgi:hypothetical protein